MLRISWRERKIDKDVLRTIKQTRNVCNHIKNRRMEIIGHVTRKEGIPKTIIEGNITGKPLRGRPLLH